MGEPLDKSGGWCRVEGAMWKVVVVALLALAAVGCGASRYAVASWQYVQAERTAQGLDPLEWDAALAGPAQARAQEIAELGALDHGGALAASVSLYGEHSYFCEVLGRQPLIDPGQGKALLDAIGLGWVESSEHAACVLGAQYHRAAIAAYMGTDGKVYEAMWLTE